MERCCSSRLIYVKTEGNDFQYEIEDVLKLFYNDSEIINTDTGFIAGEGDVFLFVESGGCGGKSELRITLKTEEAEHVRAVPVTYTEDGKKDYEKRKELKRELKRQLYMLLSHLTGKKLPWGILTGIRPGKIVHGMFKQGLEKDEILNKLQDYYKVSSSKSSLLYSVADAQRSILESSRSDMVSIYVGIPFCPTRCLYCSFTSNPIDRCVHLVGDYIKALKEEIEGVKEIISKNRYMIQNIYIGGGTPTSIDAPFLSNLLEFIEKSFAFEHVEEYTIEAGRPDSIDQDKLKAIKASKATRISINPQTMNDSTLELVGRKHTARDIIDKFNLARKMGFNNINMDIIIGLPGENLHMFENTLKEIRKLEPESLTVHTMAIKRASRLNEDIEKFDLLLSQEASDMIDMAREYARSMGMYPYYLYRQKNMLGNLENIGYCKPGFEGIYNIQIMEEKQTIIALGPGAITKVIYPEENRIERAFNVKNVEEYIKRVHEMVQRKKGFFENYAVKIRNVCTL